MSPDGGFLIVDCVEFSAELRRADPACDVAFLAMDLEIRGLDELARGFLEAWSRAALARAHEEFRAETFGARTLALYRELLGETEPGTAAEGPDDEDTSTA